MLGVHLECAASSTACHSLALCFLRAGIYQVYAHDLSIYPDNSDFRSSIGVNPLYVSVGEGW